MLLDHRKEEVIKLLNDGLSMEKMSKVLGVSFTAVRNFLNKNNLKTKARHSVVNPNEILELNARGLTNRQISKITGVNENTVGKIIKSKKFFSTIWSMLFKVCCSRSIDDLLYF